MLLLALTAAATAHADASIPTPGPTPGRPRTPLGPRCDDALERAQREFLGGFTDAVHFHVSERAVEGRYQWSDQCGVYGYYAIELAPDKRVPHRWRWKNGRRGSDEEGWAEYRAGTRRAHGWRATISSDRFSYGPSPQSFERAFRPALDLCLGS